MDKENEDIFDDDNAVPNNWVKWGKIGDRIQGTLLSVRTMKSRLPGKEGEDVQLYEIKADGGEFHDIDENKKPISPAITIKEGEYWSIGGKDMIDRQLRNVKVGTKIGLKFMEEIPNRNKKLNATKVIKVFVSRSKDGNPVMDEKWLEEQQAGFDQ